MLAFEFPPAELEYLGNNWGCCLVVTVLELVADVCGIELIKLLVTVVGMSEFKDKGRRAAEGTFTGLDTEPIVLS